MKGKYTVHWSWVIENPSSASLLLLPSHLLRQHWHYNTYTFFTIKSSIPLLPRKIQSLKTQTQTTQQNQDHNLCFRWAEPSNYENLQLASKTTLQQNINCKRKRHKDKFKIKKKKKVHTIQILRRIHGVPVHKSPWLQ